MFRGLTTMHGDDMSGTIPPPILLPTREPCFCFERKELALPKVPRENG